MIKNIKLKKLAAGVLFGILFMWPLTALAQNTLNKEKISNNGPIAINADHLEASENDREVIFTGKVVARQGDLTLSCDWLKVTYTDNKSQAGQTLVGAEGTEGMAISRIDCRGGVQITQADQVAVGDEAVYLAENTPRRIILTGNARLWKDNDYLSGHQVTYYLDDGRSVVEGADGQRVKATYYQGKKPPKPARPEGAR